MTNIDKDFEEILKYAHFWNWFPDLDIVRSVYKMFPNSYSVLTPFVYSYLEELIRSTTSEYGREFFDESGNPKNRKVGIRLINLAIEENKKHKPEYSAALEKLKSYFKESDVTDKGDNRNSVAHGYMHSRYWTKESFEKLIHDIALISKYTGF